MTENMHVNSVAKKISFFILLIVLVLVIFIDRHSAVVSLFDSYGILFIPQPSPPLKAKRQHIVCVDAIARMGNNMFQFASSYGIARSKGMRLVVPNNFRLLKIFKLNVEVAEKNSPVCNSNRIVTRSEQKCCAFDRKLVNFSNTTDVRLATYLASYYYFDNYSSEIRKMFTFRDEIITKSNDILENIFAKFNITSSDNVTLIGVHIRRGDYVNNPFGYSVATKEYLQKAVSWFQSRYTNLFFIVATNGIDWTKNNMPKNISVSYLQGNFPEVDMATISSCEHFIATVGTFSWWSAWLTGGNVTYYKWPAKEGTTLRRKYSENYSDFYYPHWIGL